MQMSWRRGLVASGLVAIGLLTVSGSAARAQPSDAQIIRDLKSPGVISVKLLGRGSRVWSTGYSQYTWDRTAIVVRKAGLREFPNASVEICGIATYSIVGGRFPFKKFYVSYNSYIGIPAPSAKTIVALLKTDMSIFLGNDALFIVGPVQPIALAANPKWNWHTPNSVSLRVTTGYKKKVSLTELEQQKVVKEIRLYRNAIKSPWNRFASSLESSTPSGRTTHDADADVRAIKWTPFVSNNARLKMSFPAKPTETQSQMNGQYPMWTVEASNDLVLCRAVAVMYPKFLNRMQSQTAVNSAMQELVSSNGMSIKISSDLSSGTYGKVATLQKDGAVMKVRIYALGNVLYQLVLSGSPATMNVVKDNEFFNSFEALR